MRARTFGVAVAGWLVLAALTGCFSPSPELQRARQEFLDAAIEEFEAPSLGEVVCEFDGGEAALGRGYTQTYLFAGDDAWQPLIDRFVELGYTGNASETSESMSFTRSDGMLAGAEVIASPKVDDALFDHLRGAGCETDPEGSLFLRFEERGPSLKD